MDKEKPCEHRYTVRGIPPGRWQREASLATDDHAAAWLEYTRLVGLGWTKVTVDEAIDCPPELRSMFCP